MEISVSMHVTADDIEQVLRRFLPSPPSPVTATNEPTPTPTATKGKPGRKPLLPVMQEPSSEAAIVLAPGNVTYRVEADGIPLPPWNLDYPAGQFPAKRGSLISFRDREYRVSKVYGTNLYLSSMDAEKYWIRPEQEVARSV